MSAPDSALVLRYENNLDDIEAWVDAHYRQSKTMRRTIRRSQIWFILIGLAILMLSPQLWFIGLFVAVPAVAFMPRLFYSSSRRSARELYLEDGSPHGVGRQEVVATSEGLEVRYEKSRHFYSWSLVQKVVHGPNHTFIYIGSVSAIVIPHRNTDPMKREQLISRIRHALPSHDTPPDFRRALPDGDV